MSRIKTQARAYSLPITLHLSPILAIVDGIAKWAGAFKDGNGK